MRAWKRWTRKYRFLSDLARLYRLYQLMYTNFQVRRLADLFKATKHVSGGVRENARSCDWLSPPLREPRLLEVLDPTWPGGLQPSPQGAPRGLPAGGAQSRVSGLRARVQPAPGTGPAAPPPRCLCGRASRQRSRSESSAPRRAPGAHRAPTAAAAQPPAVSSARLRARRAGWGDRSGAGQEETNCSGALAPYSLSPPPPPPGMASLGLGRSGRSSTSGT